MVLGKGGMVTERVDRLVLGTVNASWKRAIDATTLTTTISTGQLEGWLPHLATFFNEVRAELVLEFARAHGINNYLLLTCYQSVAVQTGERNLELERLLRENE